MAGECVHEQFRGDNASVGLLLLLLCLFLLWLLLLLLLIGISGAMTTFVAHTDVVAVKAFFRALMYFNFSEMPNLPTDPFMVVHLLLVAVLMIIFPISKLLHAPGVFFSPTRNQVDNPREQRHVADWARKLEQ